MRALWALAVLALGGPTAAVRCVAARPGGDAHATWRAAARPSTHRARELHRPARARPVVRAPPRGRR